MDSLSFTTGFWTGWNVLGLIVLMIIKKAKEDGKLKWN